MWVISIPRLDSTSLVANSSKLVVDTLTLPSDAGSVASNQMSVLLSAQAVAKSYGAIKALQHVDFNLRTGEVHALFGANGAGKSTLARIICGHVTQSAGTLRLNGNTVRFSNPRAAIDAGVCIVTQETSLANELPVWENIVLPFYGARKRQSIPQLRAIAATALDQLGFADDIELNTLGGDLSSAHRQMIEIARAVALESKVIIFDEPTAALSPNETARLFRVMDTLRSNGHGLIFVSHRLEEIFAITDRITVLRDGHSVANDVPTADLTQTELVQLMVGREVPALRAGEIPDTSQNAVALRVDGLAAGPMVHDVSLDVHAGEIVGIGGLVGSGRSELAEALMGLRPMAQGNVNVLGQDYNPTTPAAAAKAGLGFLPEDRRRQSIIPDFSVRENILLGHLSGSRGLGLGYESRRARIAELSNIIELPQDRLDETSLFNFSGGMQQKALIMRALLLSPKVLILDEPTKGVDIGSRATIYALLRQLAEDGIAILLISSDFEELLALSHRIVTISDGRTIGSVKAADIDEKLLTLMSAPRSSLGRQQALLKAVAHAFNVQAAWVIRAGSKVLCLSREGGSQGLDLPQAGDVVQGNSTVVAAALKNASSEIQTEADGRSSFIVPVKNQRKHDLGSIVMIAEKGAQISNVKLRQFIADQFVQLDGNQFQLAHATKDTT